MARLLLHDEPEPFACVQEPVPPACHPEHLRMLLPYGVAAYRRYVSTRHLHVCHAFCAAWCRMSRLQGNERSAYKDAMADRRTFLPDTSSSPRRDASLRHSDFRTPYIRPYQGSERQYLGKSIAHSPVLGSIVMQRGSPDTAKNHGWQSMTAEQAKVGNECAMDILECIICSRTSAPLPRPESQQHISGLHPWLLMLDVSPADSPPRGRTNKPGDC